MLHDVWLEWAGERRGTNDVLHDVGMTMQGGHNVTVLHDICLDV